MTGKITTNLKQKSADVSDVYVRVSPHSASIPDIAQQPMRRTT